MDGLTNNWWLWLGVIALLSWAYARTVARSPRGTRTPTMARTATI
jgi:hypothetical protein